jgi:hypothetical protein
MWVARDTDELFDELLRAKELRISVLMTKFALVRNWSGLLTWEIK